MLALVWAEIRRRWRAAASEAVAWAGLEVGTVGVFKDPRMSLPRIIAAGTDTTNQQSSARTTGRTMAPHSGWPVSQARRRS